MLSCLQVTKLRLSVAATFSIFPSSIAVIQSAKPCRQHFLLFLLFTCHDATRHAMVCAPKSEGTSAGGQAVEATGLPIGMPYCDNTPRATHRASLSLPWLHLSELFQ